jgi:hypothetical protein
MGGCFSQRNRTENYCKGWNAMMSTRLPEDASSEELHKGYRVVSVKKTSDPALKKPGDWYCYTIVGGKSRITGLHRGTLAEVTEYAEECAAGFNMRSMASTAKAMTWSSRNRK